jgi:hypothetical protein
MIISGFFTNLYGTEFGGRPNAYKKKISFWTGFVDLE